jgi:NAD-dependent deacetylase
VGREGDCGGARQTRGEAQAEAGETAGEESRSEEIVGEEIVGKEEGRSQTPDVIDHARELIASAERVVVLTGAGISAESGVPTFRGSGGLWKSYRAEDLATPEAFRRDARLVWEWYGWRREVVRACAPNAAHTALAQFAATHSQTLIATQNVDGLHRDAGTPEHSLVELHGGLFRVRCTSCTWRAAHTGPIDASSSDTLPTCEQCGALARPDIVWFGESLEPANIERAFSEASVADVCLVIGTSGVVQPAASMAAVTRQAGGAVIEVNPAETPITSIATISIRGTAVETVPPMLRAL